MESLFPIFLNLAGKNCLVVGGGAVAARKTADLLNCKTKITVVSPEAESRIKDWDKEGSVVWRKRPFGPDDLSGMYLVMAATGNTLLNQEIAELCCKQGILINSADDPANCDFFVPSVIRRKSLAIAISTEGKSPLFARLLRQRLESFITDSYGDLVELLGEKREIIKTLAFDDKQRGKLIASLINEETLELLEQGEDEKIRERIEECMSSWRG
ncbi:MAG: bifunctional precorrin-2 dehydrogenase/sirohydrochlorin ferrochelatase [Syntrophomonadaceae bacterium]|jgi:precorrin-2 dehydrogenase/sirohydrochlorin ferrochelatase|nr:bifunctional precorrin-2 dehydrogenase/sirohydrochlorin ferrochelatase [Syntrophomonadaceae bacterium]